MLSVYTITMDTNEHFAFFDKEEAYKAMRTCMDKDVNFYYMERYLVEGGRHHLVISGEKYKTKRDTFFNSIHEKPDSTVEERVVESLDMDASISKEKKVIVKETASPDIESDQKLYQAEKEAEKPKQKKDAGVEAVSEKPKRKKDAADVEAVAEKPKRKKDAADVEAVAEKPKRKKDVEDVEAVVEKPKRKKDVEDVAEKPKRKKDVSEQAEAVAEEKKTCVYVFSRGDRKGESCDKQRVAGKDVCRVHDK